MKYKKLKLCVFFLLSIGPTGLQAQEATPVSGGNASGSGGTASYTVGQVVYTTNTGTNGSVAQGVQQPYEISVVTGIEQAKGINLECSAYPNPTTDYLTLKVVNSEFLTFNFQLYDINGKLLESKRITDNETRIDMNNRVPAIYFLKVMQAKDSNSKDTMHCVSIFKIIKIQ